MLFVAARLTSSSWDSLPFAQRVALVREHYVLRPKWQGIVEREWFFPEAGIGIYVAYQQQPRKLFFHESRDGCRVDFISHPPFGYHVVAPDSPLERLPSALARAVDADSAKLLNISPAQNILTIDDEAQAFLFHNDLLGLAKAYMLDTSNGHVVASRPIAAHLMAARKPALSGMGWAAQQLHGWFLSHLTPFQNTRELLGGTMVRLDRDGFYETRHMHVGKWFTEPPLRSMFDGFERFMTEFDEFIDSDDMDVALSGGRDSRASAALFSHFHAEKICFRTNEPPALEGIIARKLVEALPNFSQFDSPRQRAQDASGRLIWKANTPKVIEIETYERAREWAYVGEGLNTPAAIYASPPSGPIFSGLSRFVPSISGVAGESAKAYYWSQRMVSGAYALSVKDFKTDITTIPIRERLKSHPLTIQSELPFIAMEYRKPLLNMIYAAQQEATTLGIHGYRFLDYWWLTDRFGIATAAPNSDTIMPFMVPEYISYALQRPPAERSRGQALGEMVERYRPEWKGISYYDEIQNSVPRDQLRAYRERSLLWEGELAEKFFEILLTSPAFEDPYDRDAIVSYFKSEIDHTKKQVMNLRALSFVLRNAIFQLCEDVGKAISDQKLAS